MRLNLKQLNLGAAVLTGLLFTTSCSKDEAIRPFDDASIETRGLITSSPVNTGLIGLSPNNELVFLMSGPPVVDNGTLPIIGLRDGEFMLAIDTRPSTKELFGVSSFSTLYTINTTTGEAVSVSVTPFVPSIDSAGTVALDFNPLNDQLRLITDTGLNLRISPETGAVIGTDPSINPLQATLNSIAYTYSQGTLPSIMYGLDPKTGFLYKQLTGPLGGSLTYVGDTGFTFSGDGGFEVSTGQTAFAVQFGRSRLGPVFSSDPQYDDITQETHRLMKVDLRKAKITSYGKVRPMIGLAIQ
jgi:Domain of unknown function (DUF4394)